MGWHGRAAPVLLGWLTAVVISGCGSTTPTVVVNDATVTPGIADFGAALQERLTTLHTCVSGSEGLDRQASSVCYDGFAYTLDGVAWPANSTPDVASLRTAATDTAGCLKSKAASCDADVARLNTYAARVAAEVK